MQLDLRQSIRTAAIRLAWVYVAVLALAILTATSFNHFLHQRLANAFTQSARNDLITRDLRKAIAVLSPSLSSSFKSVAFFGADSGFVFALPTEREETALANSVWYRNIDVPISSTADPEQTAQSSLRFTYAWTPTALTCLVLWLAVLAFAYPIFLKIRQGIERRHKEILKNRSAEIISEISAQVAHDIRSPLVALEVAVKETASLPEDQRALVNNATARIRDIANDLLHRNQLANQPTDTALESQRLAPLVEAIVKEKQIEYRTRTKVKIEAKIEQDITAKVSAADFKRVLSNLVNNAMEATKRGSVQILLRQEQNTALIEVIDTGSGIPDSLQKNLGERGFTQGKLTGTGLGLFHAKQCTQAWGGELEIASQEGKGTSVSLKLPALQGRTVALIDDDPFTHQSWQISAKKRDITLACFTEFAAFQANAKNIPLSTEIYIDSDLKPEQLKGEQVAQGLFDRGYKTIFLATGTPASRFPEMPWIKGIVGKEPPWL